MRGRAGRGHFPSPSGRGWRVLPPGEGAGWWWLVKPVGFRIASPLAGGFPRPHPAGVPATFSRGEKGRAPTFVRLRYTGRRAVPVMFPAPGVIHAMSKIATRYPQSNLAACVLPWTPDFRLDVPA